MDTIRRDDESWVQKLSNMQRACTALVLGVTLSVVLAACGGGGVTSIFSGTTLTGSLIDGYIAGAKVCLDSNGNGVCDTGEPYATTATSGVFSISVPSGTSTTGKNLVAYIPTTASDTDGPISSAYTMLAPVPTASTSTIVSPLTTLVALNPASGVAGVATALGISQATITADYIANAGTSTAGAHNVAHFLAAVLASAQGTQSTAAPNSQSILNAVNAVAAQTNFGIVAGAASSGVLAGYINTATAAPGAPTIGNATGGSASATVTFTAPSSTGGSAIMGYTVTSIPAGGVDSNAGTTALTHTITALTNGTSYTFTVHATNGTGSSSESAASNSVTPAGSTATGSTLTFSSGFASTTLTVEAGGYGGYSGSNIDGYNCGAPASCGNGGAPVSNTVTAAQSGYYYYYQTSTPATAEYVGIYVQAPGVTALSSTADTAGIQINGQTNINFTFSDNPEWFTSSNKNIGVMLTLGKHYTVTSGACNFKLLAVITPTAQTATVYSIPLSSFTVTQNCGVTLANAAAALALAPISQVDFQGDSGTAALTAGGLTTGANSTVATGGVYPTTLALTGGITFTSVTAPAATVPGAPTIGTATGGNTSATVSFTAPSSNGGSAITGYTVTSIPAGGTDSNAATTALSHTVTGLTNGTSYTFTVHAINVIGNSTESAASNSVTPAAPTGGATVSTASSWALGGTADFNGATSSLVTSQPVGGLQSNAAMVVVAPAAQYFGTTFLTIANAEFCTTAHPTITLEIYAPSAGKNIDLKLEQDGNTALNIEMNKTSVAGWHTYTFNCITDSGSATTPPTAPYVEGTVYNKMSVLFNFLAVSPGETWYFDQLTYTPTAAVTYVPPAPAVDPTVKPSAPAISSASVISVFGNTYGTMSGAGFDLFPNWGQTTAVTQIAVAGDQILKYANFNYEGTNLTPTTGINVIGMTNLHLDVWSATAASLKVSLVSVTAGEQPVTINPTSSGWNSIDIPLSSYTTPDKTTIYQLKIENAVAGNNGNTIYLDNIYFWH